MRCRRSVELIVAVAMIVGLFAGVVLNPIFAVWGWPRLQAKGWVLWNWGEWRTARDGNQLSWRFPKVSTDAADSWNEAGRILTMQQGVLAYISTGYVVVAGPGQTGTIGAYALPPEVSNAVGALSVTQDGILINLGVPSRPQGVCYLNTRTGAVSRLHGALWSAGEPTHREIVVQLSRRDFQVWIGPTVRGVLMRLVTRDNVTDWDYSFDRNLLVTVEGGDAPRDLRLYRRGGSQVWSRHVGILMRPHSPSFQGGAVWVPVAIGMDMGWPILEFGLDGTYRGCPFVHSSPALRSRLLCSRDLMLLSRVTSMAISSTASAAIGR